jgi:hypothetical protein
MLVELTEVGGTLDAPLGKVFVNPRHVAMVRRGLNASDPERQSFVSELTIDGIGKVRVEGTPTQVTKQLNGAR